MPGRPMSDEQKRKKRKRERERQNGTPVIAKSWWKKFLHKFFSWTLNRLLFLRMSGCIFLKRGLVVFSYVQE